MLKIFDEFRETLDNAMINAFGHRVILYGYGRTGQFLEWYAKYYHGIEMDFIITEDWSSSIPYNFPLFRDSLFQFNYKDVKDAIVWLALPGNQKAKELCTSHGEVYDFGSLIYGDKLINNEIGKDIFEQKKTGVHDIQFMEYLECFYNCNFVTAIESKCFKENHVGAHSYRMSGQKEIFPILDKCHCIPCEEDAIFDFGCGKGAALVSFLDYGFRRVGGIEYVTEIYETLISNMKNLGIDEQQAECLHGDAATLTTELDTYNWFYFFDPFHKPVFEAVIKNICESYHRVPRKITIININPKFYEEIEKNGLFVLTNQFCADMRQKVVDIYITK